ncbi:MAG: GGDEF domain-containing protein [Bacillus sp. (in: Bacteria)]|nr:GGDEF domain-containing protein [Bacillus sp. (in: firmicutes)]
MFTPKLMYWYTTITLLMSILMNYFFPFQDLWRLFLLPSIGIIILNPKWSTGIISIIIIVSVKILTHYLYFGNITINYFQLISSTTIILLTLTFLLKKINSLIEKLEYQSFTDNLTQAFNRRYLELHSEKLFANSLTQNQQLCFLMLDIDHFKKINDNYGHHFGDLVLQELTTVIKKTVRENDVFIRMGGEEFALLMPNTTLQDGIISAEMIRKIVERVKFEHNGNFISITISIGITQYEEESLERLVQKADLALYQAKANGRNNVVTFSQQLSNT